MALLHYVIPHISSKRVILNEHVVAQMHLHVCTNFSETSTQYFVEGRYYNCTEYYSIDFYSLYAEISIFGNFFYDLCPSVFFNSNEFLIILKISHLSLLIHTINRIERYTKNI